MTDDVVAEALDEVDANHDGFLEETDIPGLLAAMQRKPYAVLCRYYWQKYRDPDTNKIGLDRFKQLVSEINEMVAEGIN